MKELPHTRSCFVCGEANPIGLNLRFETDGRIVQTRFSPRAEHIGFKQTVHGGLIATLLDEAMVWACAVQSRRFAFCAEFTIRFVHPLQPDDEAIVTAELTANRHDKIYEAKAQAATRAAQLLASATGKYVPITKGAALEMVSDIVGDPGWVFGTA